MTYKIVFTKNAEKDIQKIRAAGLENKVNKIKVLTIANPNTSIAKKLSKDLKGLYSIRINLQHRLVYKVYGDEKVIKILSMWSHYDF